jgi:uncharacterized repeat protein (TIGR03803 family)
MKKKLSKWIPSGLAISFPIAIGMAFTFSLNDALVIMATGASLIFPALSEAQYTVLHSFNDTLGANPISILTPLGNKLFGSAIAGGPGNFGCAFSINNDGSQYRDLFNFDSANGSSPYGKFLMLGDTLYGMARSGGITNTGCVYSVDTGGSNFKDLVEFNDTGANPDFTLTFLNHKLYGLTGAGGPDWAGNVFSMNLDGSNLTDLFDFDITDGANPEHDEFVVIGPKLYAATGYGGTYSAGCIFSIDTDGSDFRDLYDFNGTDGASPLGSLTLSGNKFYGLTWQGGSRGDGCVFSIDTDGNGYKDLFNFNGTNGSQPNGSLTLSGSLLYGLTYTGGAHDDGNIFSIDTNGSGFTDLHDFTGTDGENPLADLTLIGDIFYGTTVRGGTYNEGVVFRFKDTTITTSVKQLSVNSVQLSVYPNPCNGKFNVICHPERSVRMDPFGKGSLQINVYSVLGQSILTEILPCLPNWQGSAQDDKVMDLSNQPNGVYLYRVIANNGDLIGEGKLVIQR